MILPLFQSLPEGVCCLRVRVLPGERSASIRGGAGSSCEIGPARDLKVPSPRKSVSPDTRRPGGTILCSSQDSVSSISLLSVTDPRNAHS